MFRKNCGSYIQARDLLGIPAGCMPSIPTNVFNLPQPQLQLLKKVIAEVISNGGNADEVTRIICSYSGPRQHVYSISDSDVEARAFFVTSRIPLMRDKIRAPRMELLMFKGGKCTQSIGHYHYVFTVEWNIKAMYLKCDHGRSSVNITPIVVSTGKAIEYIKSQLAEGEALKDDSYSGYENDRYYASKSKDYKKISETNDRWHYGTWDMQLPTNPEKIEKVSAPDVYEKSVYKINMMCGLVQYTGTYRGEHYVKFSERVSDSTAKKIISGIKDSKVRAYFF